MKKKVKVNKKETVEVNNSKSININIKKAENGYSINSYSCDGNMEKDKNFVAKSNTEAKKIISGLL